MRQVIKEVDNIREKKYIIKYTNMNCARVLSVLVSRNYSWGTHLGRVDESFTEGFRGNDLCVLCCSLDDFSVFVSVTLFPDFGLSSANSLKSQKSINHTTFNTTTQLLILVSSNLCLPPTDCHSREQGFRSKSLPIALVGNWWRELPPVYRPWRHWQPQWLSWISEGRPFPALVQRRRVNGVSAPWKLLSEGHPPGALTTVLQSIDGNKKQ